MAVVCDTGFLIPLLDPSAQLADQLLWLKLNHLIISLHQQGDVIIVPTPALTELLAGAGAAANAILHIINTSSRFSIEPFDTRAAIEAAAHSAAVVTAGKPMVTPQYRWQTVKVDIQIVAIARVHGARAIYSNDAGVRRVVQPAGPAVYNFADLPLPTGPQAAIPPGWLPGRP
jgi:predicted nucleic acid-binding protein